VSGTTVSDTFHIGTLSTQLLFGLATNVSSEFDAYPMDGILGLGRGADAPGGWNPRYLMDALAARNIITSRLYGVHLSRAKDGTANGELNLGAPNKDRYTGDLNWLDTVPNDRGFWEIGIADAGADGASSGLKGRSGIVDTGTSYILMPQADAVAMHKLVPGSSQSGETFRVPCDTKKEMQITFGKTMYNISTADWVGGTLAAGGCQSNIIGRQTFGETQWLLGDVFLKNVYTAFDFDKGKVGLGVESGSGSGSGETKTSTMGSGTMTSSAPSSGASTATPTTMAEASPKAQSAQQAGAAGRAGASALGSAVAAALGLLAVLA
jgi:hypothetical protein